MSRESELAEHQHRTRYEASGGAYNAPKPTAPAPVDEPVVVEATAKKMRAELDIPVIIEATTKKTRAELKQDKLDKEIDNSENAGE